MEVALDGIPNYWVNLVVSIHDIDDSITALVSRHREKTLRSGVGGHLLPTVSNRTDAVLEWMSSSIPR